LVGLRVAFLVAGSYVTVDPTGVVDPFTKSLKVLLFTMEGFITSEKGLVSSHQG
jgi:hypothetical protein